MKRLFAAIRWWWSDEGLSAPDVLLAREGEERWREEASKLRETVKSLNVTIDARESELAIRKRDIVMLSEIIKREQVRVQAETAAAHRTMEMRRE